VFAVMKAGGANNAALREEAMIRKLMATMVMGAVACGLTLLVIERLHASVELDVQIPAFASHGSTMRSLFP